MTLPANLKTSSARDRHLYPVGRIRVLETKLLERDILRELMEADSLQSVFNILRDTIYGEAVLEVSEVSEFEKMLTTETRNLIRMIDSLSPDPKLTDLPVWFFDVQNLKMLFKVHLGKAPQPHRFYPHGRFSVEKLRQLVENRNSRDLPDWMIKAKEELQSVWESNPKLRMVDAVFDRALIKAQLNVVKKMKRPVLLNYYRFTLDLYNVEAFIRIRISERSRNQFEQFFVPGGELSLSFYLDSWGGSIREAGRHFEHTAFHDLVIKSLEEYETEGTLTLLEYEGARMRMERLATSKYITFGPEPILAYFEERFFEIRLLRSIMVAKKNDLLTEGLKRRVITSYA